MYLPLQMLFQNLNFFILLFLFSACGDILDIKLLNLRFQSIVSFFDYFELKENVSSTYTALPVFVYRLQVLLGFDYLSKHVDIFLETHS